MVSKRVGGRVITAGLAALTCVPLGACASSAGSASTGSDLGALVGHRWRVTQVHDRQGVLDVPAKLRAEIGFTRDGYALGNDTQNAVQSRFRITAAGYRVSDVVVGGVGGTGLAPGQGRRIAAIDAMLGATPALSSRSDAEVHVALRGTTLRLSRDGTSLTLVRAGTQPDFGPPTGSSPTATPK